jgi:hypothetical protein
MVQYARRIVRYTNADDWNAGDTNTTYQDPSLKAGQEVIIGAYDVPASVKKATVGGGKVFVELYDDTTTAVREDGIIRFYAQGGSGSNVLIMEVHTRVLGASGKDSSPSEWNTLPEGGVYAPGGGKIIMTMESEATDNLDSTDHKWYSLPVVEYV